MEQLGAMSICLVTVTLLIVAFARCDGTVLLMNNNTTAGSNSSTVTMKTNTLAIPPDNQASTDHLKKNSVFSEEAACEAGYPCGTDQWCSPSRQVCRPCHDLEPYCNRTDLIHTHYSACEGYCYRFQMKKTQTCELQKEDMAQNLRETNSSLDAARQEAEMERTNCSINSARLQRELENLKKDIQKHAQRVSELEDEVDQCNAKQDDNSHDHAVIPTAILVTVVVLWAMPATVGVIKLWCENKRLKTAMQGDDAPAKPVKKNPNAVADNQPLISEEGKCPVTVAGTDQGQFMPAYYSVPSGVRVPGDSVVSP